jgi:hypothetical protein
MPGESRVVTAHYTASQKLEGHPKLEVNGWNVDALTIPLKPTFNIAGESKLPD